MRDLSGEIVGVLKSWVMRIIHILCSACENRSRIGASPLSLDVAFKLQRVQKVVGGLEH